MLSLKRPERKLLHLLSDGSAYPWFWPHSAQYRSSIVLMLSFVSAHSAGPGEQGHRFWDGGLPEGRQGGQKTGYDSPPRRGSRDTTLELLIFLSRFCNELLSCWVFRSGGGGQLVRLQGRPRHRVRRRALFGHAGGVSVGREWTVLPFMLSYLAASITSQH